MAFATADDGGRLHYEETGIGEALIFVHEFAGQTVGDLFHGLGVRAPESY